MTYSTRVLLGVKESLPQPVTFFRDRFFPNRLNSEKEEILFDVVVKKKRLAPWVSPLVKGKLMEAWGYVTRVFKPAHLKPKGVVRPTDAIKRVAGEPLNGSLTMGQRRDIHVRTHLREQEDAITAREEVMCVEALRLGQVTVSGDGYPTQVVNFNRAAGHRVVLTGVDLWTADTANPPEDLEEWATMVRDAPDSNGALITDWVFGTAAFAAYRKWLKKNDKDVLALILSTQNRGQTTDLQLGPVAVSKVEYRGMHGNFRLWTYADTYQDEDGNTQQVMPPNEVLGVSAAVDGTICYGAILDADAMDGSGVVALERFPKMWREPDPSAEYIMTQCAPLAVPGLIDSTMSAVVTA